MAMFRHRSGWGTKFRFLQRGWVSLGRGAVRPIFDAIHAYHPPAFVLQHGFRDSPSAVSYNLRRRGARGFPHWPSFIKLNQEQGQRVALGGHVRLGHGGGPGHRTVACHGPDGQHRRDRSQEPASTPANRSRIRPGSRHPRPEQPGVSVISMSYGWTESVDSSVVGTGAEVSPRSVVYDARGP